MREASAEEAGREAPGRRGECGRDNGRWAALGAPWAVRARYREWLAARLRRALEGADRARAAELLGERACTLEDWLKDSRPESVVRGDALVQLLCRDDVLEERAREELLRALAREAGFFVVRLPDAGGGLKEIERAVVALAEELGKVASDVRAAEEHGGHSPGELARVVGDAQDLAAEALALAAMGTKRLEREHRLGAGKGARP